MNCPICDKLLIKHSYDLSSAFPSYSYDCDTKISIIYEKQKYDFSHYCYIDDIHFKYSFSYFYSKEHEKIIRITHSYKINSTNIDFITPDGKTDRHLLSIDYILPIDKNIENKLKMYLIFS